jgi:hypothetical protein
MPRADLVMTGNSNVSSVSKAGYIITNRLSYTGSSTFTVGAIGGTSQALGVPTAATLIN